MIRIRRANSEDVAFQTLVKQLDADLHLRNGDDQFQYDLYNKIESLSTVVIASDENKPVGCACFKNYSSDAAELKRMYLHPDFRGRGVADSILNEIENWAKENGMSKIVLETGLKQPEAIRFYTKNGYIRIPNFGHYIGNLNSVCMQKILNII